jgi:DNA replication factor GINS
MPVVVGLAESQRIRIQIVKDLPQFMGLGPYKAGTAVQLPVYTALRLVEIGAAKIDESSLLRPQEVAGLNFVEEREQLPAKLPEDFYARLRATVAQLKKDGDSKALSALISAARDLLIRRVEKMARLLAASPELIDDEDFQGRLAPEERALAAALHGEVKALLGEILSP